MLRILMVLMLLIVLAFPALWMLGSARLLAVALVTATTAYLAGRLAAGNARRPLQEDITPLGDALIWMKAMLRIASSEKQRRKQAIRFPMYRKFLRLICRLVQSLKSFIFLLLNMPMI